MVQDFAVACIELQLQLQPLQFWHYSTAVPYILAIPSAVTLFYITSARLKDDCGVHGSPRLRVHGRRTGALRSPPMPNLCLAKPVSMNTLKADGGMLLGHIPLAPTKYTA